MAPKAKNVASSKRSRKGEVFGSANQEPSGKFGKKAVERYGWEWFEYQREPKYIGDKYVNEGYSNILCGVESMARWERSKDTGRQNTLHFPNFNQVSRVWLKIVCSALLPAKHLAEVMRDIVVLVYKLMMGMPINVGEQYEVEVMLWGFDNPFSESPGYREGGIELTIVFHPDLTGKLVDVTRTKVLDTSHGLVLSAQERQARDDTVMAIMFGMAKLQLRIGGRPVTDEDMETMVERYLLTESAAFLCRTGPAFLEPPDDDEATADEVMDDEEDDDVDEEANALMVFDGGDNEA
ncbi:hypothetical protein KY289_030248 [Solanum tuberosum]|nr:hypothetical protein KY289_030248 [Solanum tuberosum]